MLVRYLKDNWPILIIIYLLALVLFVLWPVDRTAVITCSSGFTTGEQELIHSGISADTVYYRVDGVLTTYKMLPGEQCGIKHEKH
jgi:hypothetical protein